MTTTSPMSASLPMSHTAKAPYHEASPEKDGKSADFDTFIKLLVTQMKNQNPDEPMDATQYVAQLASFSAVEQAAQTNSKLAQLGATLDALLAGNSAMQAGDYVGQYVSNEDGSICGIVKSVKIYSDGLVATLEGGKELLIGAGVTISKPEEAKSA